MNAASAAAAQLIQPAQMSTSSKVFAFGVMCIGMFVALLDIQIVSASLRDIGGGLSAGNDETTWVQTSYLIAEIIVIPLSGWLTRTMSTRWLFAFSAAGFTLTSLLCGLAWNIQSMIVFRALQGFLGGSMIPTVFTTAFAFFDNKQRVIAASTIGAIASLAPTLGPTVGGWITDHYSWHWLFFINLLPGIFITLTVPRLVRIDLPDWSLIRRADYPGILLMSLFLGCLEYTLEEGPRWDWMSDPVIATTAWVAGFSGVLFVWRSLTAAGGGLAGAEGTQFCAGMFLFLRHRHRHLRHHLSHAPVPGPGARLQCAADRAGGVFHRAVPDHVYPALCLAHTPSRPALDHDDRAGSLHAVDVAVRSHHA
jgi:DHA2 family multidrug resistance protein